MIVRVSLPVLVLALAACTSQTPPPPSFADDLTTLEGQTRAFTRDAGIAEFLVSACAEEGIALRDGSATGAFQTFFDRQTAAGNNAEAIAAAVAAVDQDVLGADTAAYIEARGLRPEDGSTPCEKARAEIADGTGVGRLLVAG